MTGITGLTLPSISTVAGLVIQGVFLLAAASGGAYLDHRLMDGKVARAKTEAATIQSEYSQYKARVAADAAKANADALAERTRLSAALAALQDQLAAQKKIADAKSAELKRILQDASPQDTRPIGPVVRDYLERLRGP